MSNADDKARYYYGDDKPTNDRCHYDDPRASLPRPNPCDCDYCNRDHHADLNEIKLSDYEVANLQQLLRVTKAGASFDADTGDWHAQLRNKLEGLAAYTKANVSDSDLISRMVNAYHKDDRL